MSDLAKVIGGLEFEVFLVNGVSINQIAKMDTDDLAEMIKNGFRHYGLPVESATQRIVDLYWSKKTPDVRKTSYLTCLNLKKASEQAQMSIRRELYQVIGHVGVGQERESIEEMYDSVCFARYLVENELIDYSVFSLFLPLPGTLPFECLLRDRKILDPELMTFGKYCVIGEGMFSPESLEALRYSGWRFSNRNDVVEDRSSYNLDTINQDSHLETIKEYREIHLNNLSKRYEIFLDQLMCELAPLKDFETSI